MQAEKKLETSNEPPPVSAEKKSTKLVLFDFDGTITTRDTLWEFLLFYRGKVRVALGLVILSPVLIAYALKIIPNWRAKEMVLRHFLGNTDEKSFNTVCQEFARRIIPKLVRPKAMQIIDQYIREGASVIVVSASPENWVGPWCEKHGLTYLATQLEVSENKLTGNICGKNCYGPEKVNRIKAKYSLVDYHEIIAYGDSSGDREMLAIAHQNFYKPFRDK
jgi:phosphatidylglycerophosphatase C